MTRVWYGVAADKPTCDALLRAIDSWCTCEFNEGGVKIRQCASHAALIEHATPHHATWAERLLCERARAAQLVAQEWCQSEPPIQPESAAPTPVGMCQCGHWDSLHYGPFDHRKGCFAPALWPDSLLCRCPGFMARDQPRPASDGLILERLPSGGFAWLRRAA
jgi:hypothetical protein